MVFGIERLNRRGKWVKVAGWIESIATADEAAAKVDALVSAAQPGSVHDAEYWRVVDVSGRVVREMAFPKK